MAPRKKKERAPAYQWYPKDWRASSKVRAMTREQRDMYRDLLDTQWLDGSIPADPAELAALLGEAEMPFATTHWPRISKCFVRRDDGTLVNERLERQRGELQAYTDAKARAGTTSAVTRWGGEESRVPGARTRSQRLAIARSKGTHDVHEWAEMLTFFGRACLRCKVSGPGVKIVKDHIVSLYLGGDDSIRNLQPLCDLCNSTKGKECIDFRPLQGREIPSKWLPAPTDATETPGKRLANGNSASASASPIPDPSVPSARLPLETVEPAADTPPRRKPVTEHRGIVGDLARLWAAKHPTLVDPAWGGECARISPLAKQHGEDALRRWFSHYLTVEERFVAGHPLKLFISQLDKWRSLADEGSTCAAPVADSNVRPKGYYADAARRNAERVQGELAGGSP